MECWVSGLVSFVRKRSEEINLEREATRKRREVEYHCIRSKRKSAGNVDSLERDGFVGISSEGWNEKHSRRLPTRRR
jgi:hypothetical protein